MTDIKGSTSSHPDIHAQQKEWDEISCPICMDHPHNAVLLICTSHESGCRSYICDTSYRHSNCLDRFKKLRVDHDHDDDHHSQSTTSIHNTQRLFSSLTSEPFPMSRRTRRNPEENNNALTSNTLDEHRHTEQDNDDHEGSRGCLKCPLCRGTVKGWKIVKEARVYWDTKPRSCSRESCLFSGNYSELRRHARRVHPMTRPADVDPSRQRAWSHLEHQREYGDILSAVRSAMPGSFVLGDYVIDDEDASSHDRELGDASGPWWATLFLFHMMSGSVRSRDEFRASSRTWRTRRNASGNRYLWGENLLGLQDDDNNDDDDDNDDDDGDDDIQIPRRRIRFTRARSDEERP